MTPEPIAIPKWPETIAECHQLLTAFWLELHQLRAEVAELRAENAALRAEMATLREQVGQNSQNTSRPPSSDGPKKPKRPPRPPGKRRRGGQPGHTGRTRLLVPSEQVDEVVECRPAAICGECGGPVQIEPEPVERRQQVEVPPVQPVVTEFRRYVGACLDCGRHHQGQLPRGSRWWLGPRALSILALLSSRFHLSKRLIVELCQELLGLVVSVGTVSASDHQVSEAVAPAVAEAHQYVQQQPVVNADETSCPQGNADGQNPTGTKGWLWVAVTAWVTVFMVRLSRGQQVAKALLGEGFAGILGSDRWSGYGWVSRWLRQLCWAHLKREFTKIAERGGESGRIGAALLAEEARLFRYWHRVRDGTLQRSTFRTYVGPIRQRVGELLREAAAWPVPGKGGGPDAKTARTCRDLLHLEAALWVFVRNENVEPTNNQAERSIRSFVLWRKGSFGTQSARGSRFVERMLTVVATSRQQGRSTLEYLTEAVTAYRQGQPAPSLLPVVASTPSLTVLEADRSLPLAS